MAIDRAETAANEACAEAGCGDYLVVAERIVERSECVEVGVPDDAPAVLLERLARA